ncbi:hypothetical protein E2C01_047722 [Portunus trituberculatus]|uniref:Uncharacterized protein n=1 Tax=Portunus trituberculatus TaxID=210409 RepID=A0A5B7G1B0_PORTR|nr:hypothetical protein [Portunus trituberculatus]
MSAVVRDRQNAPAIRRSARSYNVAWSFISPTRLLLGAPHSSSETRSAARVAVQGDEVSQSAVACLWSCAIARNMCGYVKHKPVKGKRGGEERTVGLGEAAVVALRSVTHLAPAGLPPPEPLTYLAGPRQSLHGNLAARSRQCRLPDVTQVGGQ